MQSVVYDVAVIGAGVVGCAIARRFTLEGANVVILEKSTDILDGASKGNSGILHTGFDAVPGSLESHCVQAGYREYLSIHEKLNLPLLSCGAMVVAWTEADEARLKGIETAARQNGVDNVHMMTRQQVLTREPLLSSQALAALLVPDECIIDPWTAPHMYMRQAIENGASLLRNREVITGQFKQDRWQLDTANGSVSAGFVINCAGLYGDQVDNLLFGKTSFTIKPRKGQFIVFDKPAAEFIKTIVLPVPTPTTKGVVICRTSFGNVLVGPTAEEQDSRTDASVERSVLTQLKDKAFEIVPALREVGVTATYAGIRPATEVKDYCIRSHPDKNAITVGGIRSTGLSAALGIATHVHGLYTSDNSVQHTEVESVYTPCAYPLAADAERDWSKPDNGGIVCHCEWVTRREIIAALTGNLPAWSLCGLKRQTRATMGRCQGFYCSAELAAITDGYFSQSSETDNASKR